MACLHTPIPAAERTSTTMRLPFVVLVVALTSPLAAQQPQAQSVAPSDSLTLIDAIRIGRERGVNAVLAQLNVRAANARIGERRSDLLPTIAGQAGVTRQTLNLDEFGIPIATGVTPAFDIWRLRVSATQ